MPKTSQLRERVNTAADRVLRRNGAVGPIDLLVEMRLIADRHFQQWQRSEPSHAVLQPHIQCGPEKLNRIFRLFKEWTEAGGHVSTLAPYLASGLDGTRQLRLLTDDDPQQETFLQTRFHRADQTPARKKQIEKKLNKAPDLLVYVLTSENAQCSECDTSIETGELMYRESDSPFCLTCADFDHLEFLPSGNATLTRRAKKFSALSAVVVQFNRRRKRYDRRGILVSQSAIDQAQESMDADADKRGKQRKVAAVRRVEADVALVEKTISEIATLFPGCPSEDARRIAEHATVRGSGRVGRSAAGREADQSAIKLAVIAHIRHEHTDYDEMLMSGVARRDARVKIRSTVQAKLEQWQE